MDIILPGYSKVYFVLAIGYMLLDYNVLRRVMRPDHWLMLRAPALILHELAHFVVALVLLAWPRISFKWVRSPDGTVEMGRVIFGTPLMGGFGRMLISVAPLMLYFVALWIARSKLSGPLPVVAGLGWLAALYLCVSAAAMFSRSDLDGVGLLGRLMILLTILFIMVEPVVRMAAFVFVLLGKPEWMAPMFGPGAAAM